MPLHNGVPACLALSAALAFTAGETPAQDLFFPEALQSLLPPSPDWHVAREGFVAGADSDWITPAEQADFLQSATYGEAIDYVRRLAAASDKADLLTLATLPNDEELVLLVVSNATDKTPEGLAASGLPTLFVHSGIHPGESSGVDAGLMLSRDLSMGGQAAELLDKANFIYLPVLNVNGYLRRSEHGRMNQYGPDLNGRRANGRWLNLNRDFAKLDSTAIRAVVDVFNTWNPTFYIDAHDTDGINYQYDVTWCDNGASGYSPNIYAWLRGSFSPAIEVRLAGLGHIPGTCIDANDDMNWSWSWSSPGFVDTF